MGKEQLAFSSIDGLSCVVLVAIGRPFWLGLFAAGVYLISMMVMRAVIRRRLP